MPINQFVSVVYYVYILFSERLGKFYIGQTNDLDCRVKRHNAGYEVFTSKGVPWSLVWSTSKSTRSEAMILEKKLKNLSQKRITAFIEKYSNKVSGPDDACVSGC